MKVLRRAPPSELAQAFGNGGSVEFLLGPLLTSALDTALNESQLRRIHMHVYPDCPLLASKFLRILDGSNLIVLNFFGGVVGVTVLIVGTERIRAACNIFRR